MDYDAYVQELIDVLKADKSIAAEWRNDAIKTFKRGRAFIHEGKSTTYRQVPDDLPIMKFGGGGSECICTDLGKRKDCPVHGGKA